MNKTLHSYMTEVMQECSDKVPQSARFVDPILVQQYPTVYAFYLSYPDVMSRACAARRYADSRADAIEMAVDSILAKTWYVRVGEVWEAEKMTQETDPETGILMIVPGKTWATLVVERD